MEELAEIRKRRILKLRPLSMVLCVSHTQVAVLFLTTCQTVMPTVVVVHSLAVGNMTFTTCHRSRAKEYPR